MTEASGRDRYLAPGTKVALRNPPEGSPEHGVVVHCWGNDEIGAYDCYVAFFGSEAPVREPVTKPYVFRYAASSLKVTEPSPHALMLRDTVLEMKEHLDGLAGESDFDRGYAMAYDFATRTLKQQCDVFGLRDDLGWLEPDLEKWLKSDD
ncbi:MAG: hypothetical protein ACK4SZ_06870 [Allosphingosinicella sp.]|uniref:hypothetical protein n=1 Tax=Allosphingosinicella sp. TaxID=2823234 RepID=UPI00395CCD9A